MKLSVLVAGVVLLIASQVGAQVETPLDTAQAIVNIEVLTSYTLEVYDAPVTLRLSQMDDDDSGVMLHWTLDSDRTPYIGFKITAQADKSLPGPDRLELWSCVDFVSDGLPALGFTNALPWDDSTGWWPVSPTPTDFVTHVGVFGDIEGDAVVLFVARSGQFFDGPFSVTITYTLVGLE